MARHKKKKKPQGQQALIQAGSAADGATQGRIRELIGQGKSKQALDLAKQYVKQVGDEHSEWLLAEAYAARIEGLCGAGLTAEARALWEVARKRCAGFDGREAEIARLLAAHGSLDELVRPLDDPALPLDARHGIETDLRRRLIDPRQLAECEALAPNHPLRREAAEAARALEAVTSRQVSEDAIALAGISRRGPLAPWKMLVRAIAAFYAHQDDLCRRHLAMIDEDTPPARLAPVLLACLDGIKPMGQAEAGLASRLMGDRAPLRRALARLDELWEDYLDEIVDMPALAMHCRRTLELCAARMPAKAGFLSQKLFVRGYMDRLPETFPRKVFQVPVSCDAAFWRMMALADQHNGSNPISICSLWEQFRRHAVAEGILAAEGPEPAVLYMHMADLLARHPQKEIDRQGPLFVSHYSNFDDWYADQSEVVRKAARQAKPLSPECFTQPGRLYELACRQDPRPEYFRRWMAWAQKMTDGVGAAEAVSAAWCELCPHDPEPLLLQVEAAEKRNAFNKALGWLERAEAVDRLNPEVGRARLRLTVAITMRHLKQNKPRLLANDLLALEALPALAEGGGAALLGALRLLIAWPGGGGGDEILRERTRALHQCLDDPRAAAMLVQGLASAAGRPMADGSCGLARPDREDPVGLLRSFGRTADLALLGGVELELTPGWDKAVEKALRGRKLAIEPHLLRRVAEAALRMGRNQAAYAAAGHGLDLGGAETARFVLLRARSMRPYGCHERRRELAAVAVALARRGRMDDVAGAAIEFWHELNSRGLGFLFMEDGQEAFDLDPAHIDYVLKMEKKAHKYPDSWDDDYMEADKCPCPQCRGERQFAWTPSFEESAPPDDWNRPPQDRNPKQRPPKRRKPKERDFKDDLFGLDGFELDDDDSGPFMEDETVFMEEGGGDPGDPAQGRSSDFSAMPDDVPPEILQAMIEVVQHMEPGGALPTPRELEKIDPDLARRISDIFAGMTATQWEALDRLFHGGFGGDDEPEIEDTFGHPFSDPAGMPTQAARTRRRKKKGRPRK